MSHLHKDLLSILRCPVTGSRLRQGDHELISEANGPAGHPLHYPVDEGIAILLPNHSAGSASDGPTYQTRNAKA